MEPNENGPLEERAGRGLFDAALSRGINFSDAVVGMDIDVLDFLLSGNYLIYDGGSTFSMTPKGRDYAADYIVRKREGEAVSV